MTVIKISLTNDFMTPRSRWGAGVAQWQFSDDVEQELWDVLGSNPALHP